VPQSATNHIAKHSHADVCAPKGRRRATGRDSCALNRDSQAAGGVLTLLSFDEFAHTLLAKSSALGV
jgi:hypothetical protein